MDLTLQYSVMYAVQCTVVHCTVVGVDFLDFQILTTEFRLAK
jgi:hypothetical protein